jgi:plastocyanin
MNRFRHRSIVINAIVLMAGGLFLASAGATTSPTTAPATVSVAINDFNFQPKEVTVAVGETVTWVNHDDVPHTATAKGDSPAFDSKALDTDEKFSFTFKTPGSYPYYCKVHPHMTGLIIVK